eukprot:764560-Hanusia_phi.AAC.2
MENEKEDEKEMGRRQGTARSRLKQKEAGAGERSRSRKGELPVRRRSCRIAIASTSVKDRLECRTGETNSKNRLPLYHPTNSFLILLPFSLLLLPPPSSPPSFSPPSLLSSLLLSSLSSLLPLFSYSSPVSASGWLLRRRCKSWTEHVTDMQTAEKTGGGGEERRGEERRGEERRGV